MSRGPSRLSEALVWAACAAALSPLLLDLGRHLAAEPWPRYAALFAVLLAVESVTSRPSARAPATGLALVACAVAAEVLALAVGAVRYARPALPLAVAGAARAFGRPPLAAALLSLFCVPVPNAVVERASPALESTLLAVAAAPFRAAGATLAIEDARAVAPAGALALAPADGGIPLAALLAGLGWYTAVRRQESIGRAAVRAGGAALLAPPLQLGAIAVAVGMLVAGAPEAGRALLAHGLWLAVAAAGLATALLRPAPLPRPDRVLAPPAEVER